MTSVLMRSYVHTFMHHTAIPIGERYTGFATDSLFLMNHISQYIYIYILYSQSTSSLLRCNLIASRNEGGHTLKTRYVSVLAGVHTGDINTRITVVALEVDVDGV